MDHSYQIRHIRRCAATRGQLRLTVASVDFATTVRLWVSRYRNKSPALRAVVGWMPGYDSSKAFGGSGDGEGHGREPGAVLGNARCRDGRLRGGIAHYPSAFNTAPR